MKKILSLIALLTPALAFCQKVDLSVLAGAAYVSTSSSSFTAGSFIAEASATATPHLVIGVGAELITLSPWFDLRYSSSGNGSAVSEATVISNRHTVSPYMFAVYRTVSKRNKIDLGVSVGYLSMTDKKDVFLQNFNGSLVGVRETKASGVCPGIIVAYQYQVAKHFSLGLQANPKIALLKYSTDSKIKIDKTDNSILIVPIYASFSFTF